MASINSSKDLEVLYRRYIQTLNDENWSDLLTYLSANVIHNGIKVGQQGYRELTRPNTRFVISDLVVQLAEDGRNGTVASRLDITVDTKTLKEHCFYRWAPDMQEGNWVIQQVWTIWEEVTE